MINSAKDRSSSCPMDRGLLYRTAAINQLLKPPAWRPTPLRASLTACSITHWRPKGLDCVSEDVVPLAAKWIAYIVLFHLTVRTLLRMCHIPPILEVLLGATLRAGQT